MSEGGHSPKSPFYLSICVCVSSKRRRRRRWIEQQRFRVEEGGGTRLTLTGGGKATCLPLLYNNRDDGGACENKWARNTTHKLLLPLYLFEECGALSRLWLLPHQKLCCFDIAVKGINTANGGGCLAEVGAVAVNVWACIRRRLHLSTNYIILALTAAAAFSSKAIF